MTWSAAIRCPARGSLTSWVVDADEGPERCAAVAVAVAIVDDDDVTDRNVDKPRSSGFDLVTREHSASFYVLVSEVRRFSEAKGSIASAVQKFRALLSSRVAFNTVQSVVLHITYLSAICLIFSNALRERLQLSGCQM